MRAGVERIQEIDREVIELDEDSPADKRKIDALHKEQRALMAKCNYE